MSVAFFTLPLPGFADSDSEMQRTDVPELSGTFGDGMVLQRDQPIVVWGRGVPRGELTVTLAEVSRSVRIDSSGNWQIVMPSMPAGGPYELRLQDRHETVRTLQDVLVGDVWLCSGQSNMEFPVARSSGNSDLSGTPANIRLMTVQHDSRPAPQREFSQPSVWSVPNAETIPDFSALCYFFALELHETHAVPLGLIHASWGGSRIEPWISSDGLREVGGYDEQLDLLEAYSVNAAEGTAHFAAMWENWWRGTTAEADQPWKGTTQFWTAAPAVMRDWKEFGDASLAEHNGMVWFRNTFQLTADQAEQKALLSLGAIDEVDVVWVNGRFIGSQFGWGTERRYPVPPGLLRSGTNDVTVNILSTWDAGGMLGPNEDVELKFANGDAHPLGEGWQYRKADVDGLPPRAPWESIAGLSGLFNAMIAPLERLRLTGVLWYQGESNTGDATNYEKLLTALTRDWRRVFGDSPAFPLPFLIVQLPNFGEPVTAPVESGWASIRDAQRRVALADPGSGLVVTIDAGDNTDLHPPNKQIVGQRAADVARAMLFGESGLVDGVSPVMAIHKDTDEIVVDFDLKEESLVVVGDDRPVAFEVCADAPSTCHYAAARLDGDRIHLAAPNLRSATRVRHCWADAPLCNLYGTSGLPVGSFEIDITLQ